MSENFTKTEDFVKRFDRIEDKLDQLSDAMIQLARNEEKMIAISEQVTTHSERLNRHSEKIDKLSELAFQNSFTSKIVWATLAAIITAVISMKVGAI